MNHYLRLALIFLAMAMVVLVVLVVTNARADPFLVCGATSNTTVFQLDLDGVIITLPVDHFEDDQAWIEYDLEAISNGEHMAKVRAGNKWGWSIWYPLAFTKALAAVVTEPYIE